VVSAEVAAVEGISVVVAVVVVVVLSVHRWLWSQKMTIAVWRVFPHTECTRCLVAAVVVMRVAGVAVVRNS